MIELFFKIRGQCPLPYQQRTPCSLSICVVARLAPPHFTHEHKLAQAKLNKLGWIKQSFTKFVYAAKVCCARKIRCIFRKTAIFKAYLSKNNFNPLKFIFNFYNCRTAPINKTQFLITQSGEFVVYSSRILFAWCQLLDLESTQLKISKDKILLIVGNYNLLVLYYYLVSRFFLSVLRLLQTY